MTPVTDPALIARLEGAPMQPGGGSGEFAAQFRPFAQAASDRIFQRTGQRIDPNAILAQAALETGWGKSAPGNNFFGIKGAGQDLATNEFMGGQMQRVTDSFRAYESPEQSFLDYADLISGGRYLPGLAGTATDPASHGANMAALGYATDPEYGQKFRSVYQRIADGGVSDTGTEQPGMLARAADAALNFLVPPAAAAEGSPPAPQAVTDPALLARLNAAPSPAAAEGTAVPGAITDPALIQRLDAQSAQSTTVTDPAILARLNGDAPGYSPTEGIPAWQRLLEGVGKGMTDVALGAKQRATELITSDAAKLIPFAGPVLEATGKVLPENAVESLQREAAEKRTLDKPLTDTAAGKAGEMIGVAAPALLAGPAGSTYAGAATAGAAANALLPSESTKETVTNIAAGAAGGLVGKALTNAIGRVLSPLLSRSTVSPDDAVLGPSKKLVDRIREVNELRGAGIRMTPGQMLGGFVKAAEDKATSAPVVGDFVADRQHDAIEDFARAAMNKVLEPLQAIDDSVRSLDPNTPISREAIGKLQEIVGQKYDDVLSQMSLKADRQLAQDLGKIAGLAKSLPGERWKQFNSIVKGAFLSRFSPAGSMDGVSLKAAESEMRRIGQSYLHSSSADERLLGTALGEVRTAMRDAIKRTNPVLEPVLRKIDESYATLGLMEKAASSVAAKDGIFTPAMLVSAIKSADKSVRDRKFAAGEMMLQRFAESAKAILPNRIPDSGTAGRGANLAAIGAMMLEPTGTAATIAGASLPYTKVGNRVIEALLTVRPEIAEQAARKLLPRLTVPASTAGSRAIMEAMEGG